MQYSTIFFIACETATISLTNNTSLHVYTHHVGTTHTYVGLLVPWSTEVLGNSSVVKTNDHIGKYYRVYYSGLTGMLCQREGSHMTGRVVT